MSVEKPSDQEQKRLSAYEAALARIDEAYKQQLAQLKRQQQAQEDNAIDQQGDLCDLLRVGKPGPLFGGHR